MSHCSTYDANEYGNIYDLYDSYFSMEYSSLRKRSAVIFCKSKIEL